VALNDVTTINFGEEHTVTVKNAGWSSCVGFVQRGKTLSFLPSSCEDQGVHPKRRWHTLSASADGPAA